MSGVHKKVRSYSPLKYDTVRQDMWDEDRKPGRDQCEITVW